MFARQVGVLTSFTQQQLVTSCSRLTGQRIHICPWQSEVPTVAVGSKPYKGNCCLDCPPMSSHQLQINAWWADCFTTVMHISSFKGNYDVALMYNPGLSHVKHLLTYLLTSKFVFARIFPLWYFSHLWATHTLKRLIITSNCNSSLQDVWHEHLKD